MNRDQKGVNIGFLQINMLLGPVDPLHIQQINLGAAVSGEKLQFFFLQKLFALFQHGGKIIKVQRKIVMFYAAKVLIFNAAKVGEGHACDGVLLNEHV